MAITWGTAVSDASNAFRLGYEFSQSPSTVSNSTSSVTVTLNVWFGSKYGISDSSNSLSVTGNFSASGTSSISTSSSTAWSSANHVLLRTLTRTVSPSYTSTTNSSFSASLSGIDAVAGTASVSGSWTTAQRPISKPDAPTGACASRVSDTQHTITWTNTNPNDVSKPYQGIDIDRWDNITGAWYSVANIGVAQSWSDTTTVANRRYQWRVAGSNTAGESAEAVTGYRATTPAAPTIGSATKSGSDIVVTWTNNGTYQTAVEVWHAANGVWDGSALATLGATATSYTHVAPNTSVTHTYKIRAVTDGPLYSAYSADSNTVQLLAPPNAPTGLSPNSSARDATEAITLSWTHNPVDTTAQTKYEVEYRLSGAGAWTSTGEIPSSASQHVLTAGTLANGNVYEWRVRTWGEYSTAPAYSPWSANAILTASSKPTATIASPGATVTGSSLTVEWAYFDAEGTAQSQWRSTLYDASMAVVETRQGSSAATSTTFATTVEDGASYTVGVEVRDGAGLWSAEDTQAFTVSYAPPATPSATGTWDLDTGSITVAIDNPVPVGDEVATAYNEVERSIDGGPYVRIATQIPENGSVTDFIPKPGTTNTYRVRAVSTTPSSAWSAPVEIEAGPASGYAWLNAGQNFGTVIRLRGNLSVSTSVSRAKTLNHFAGRQHPVETAGEARTRTIDISALIGPETATVAQIESFVDLPAPAIYRDATGRRHFVSVKGLSASHRKTTQTVNLSLTEIDFNEADATSVYA